MKTLALLLVLVAVPSFAELLPADRAAALAAKDHVVYTADDGPMIVAMISTPFSRIATMAAYSRKALEPIAPEALAKTEVDELWIAAGPTSLPVGSSAGMPKTVRLVPHAVKEPTAADVIPALSTTPIDVEVHDAHGAKHTMRNLEATYPMSVLASGPLDVIVVYENGRVARAKMPKKIK